jgi:hypothetical protein
MRSSTLSLLDAMTSVEGVAAYSSSALPVHGLGMSRSKLGANLSASIFANVVLDAALDPSLVEYYREIGVAPKQIFVASGGVAEVKAAVAASGFKTLYTQGKSPALDAFGSELGLKPGFYDFSEDIYLSVFARDFLLISASLPSSPLRARWLSDFSDLSFEAVAAVADVFGGGFLLRQRFSVNGNDLTQIKTAFEFRQALKRMDPKGTLVVPAVPSSLVQLDLEITFLVAEDGAVLLGVSRQLSERRRHFGSESIDLESDLQAQINADLDRICSLLRDRGFTSGVLGLDAFVVQHLGKARVFAYDLNPCSAQAFFPTMATARLERKFDRSYFHRSRFFMVPLAMPFAVFREAFADLLVTSERPDAGVFPLLFDSLAAGESKVAARTLVMALLLGPDARAVDAVEAEFHDRLSRLARVSRLFF